MYPYVLLFCILEYLSIFLEFCVKNLVVHSTVHFVPPALTAVVDVVATAAVDSVACSRHTCAVVLLAVVGKVGIHCRPELRRHAAVGRHIGCWADALQIVVAKLKI